MGLYRLAADLHSESEDGGAHVDDEPVEMFLGGPAVYEEADWCEDGSRQQEGDVELGNGNTVGAVLHSAEDDIHKWTTNFRAGDFTGAHGNVVEAADGYGLVVLFGPEVGEGRKHEVGNAVVESGQTCLDLDDRMKQKETDWPGESFPQHPGQGPA